MNEANGLPAFDFLAARRAGILLHPTSLPGCDDHGDMGHAAYRFIEFLAASGISIWQTLPLGPVHEDGSPYQCLSAHAGDPRLISLEWLTDRGWLRREDLDKNTSGTSFRHHCLHRAFTFFSQHAESAQQQDFSAFCQQHAGWLDNYALYIAIRKMQNNRGWFDWPAPLRNRETETLKQVQQHLQDDIGFVKFEQYVFFSQWFELKNYAHRYGIFLFGDMPIFVAHDSCEVWSNQEYFLLDENGQPEVVAGVPPDYFSETGQRWGNPLYDWPRMAETGFQWWIERMQTQLALFDLVRIDHFRGFEACWEIPATEETAINGRWVKAPGESLLRSLDEAFSGLPLVAEDLGVITAEVNALRQQFQLPGMRILQFAFGGGADNPYLPHNHERNTVVYTGTHDNDTTRGWYDALDNVSKKNIENYLGYAIDKSMPWPLIRLALASVANMAIIPLQDVLALASEGRMNVPGTSEGNWRWRFAEDALTSDISARLRELISCYGRCSAGQ
ncbi:4-alpha-glucanotransferase (amylomaltase) [hydrothermal vent metagenome]|uniref:4-alpha-glucanotransferase n=1 Tax=hydrothermal vent metagenome TaxID=652676 RepID=A0A3B1BN33_9ZZZZ